MSLAYNVEVVACLEVELVDDFNEVADVRVALHMHELAALAFDEHPAQRVRQQRLHRVVQVHQQAAGLVQRDREGDQALQVFVQQHRGPAEPGLVQAHLYVAEKDSQVRF